MVKSKYTFEKRQREIARRKKQEDKAARRSEAKKEQAVTDSIAAEGGTEPASLEDTSTDAQTRTDQ
jgi:hypothetical protein